MVSEVLEWPVALAHEGMTMMMVVTHEMSLAHKLKHRVVFMDAGEVVENATRDAFFGRTASRRERAFLSEILTH